MTGNQLWGPEDDVPELITDDSDEEEAALNRPARPPRPDAEALLTLGVRHGPSHRPLYPFNMCIASGMCLLCTSLLSLLLLCTCLHTLSLRQMVSAAK